MHDAKLENPSQTMAPATRLTISVIVPERNGGPDLQKCLTAILEAIPSPAELIVVADGDTDGSWRIAEECGARVLRIIEAKGPARARNLGAQNAHGDILFFVDADVVIPSDALSQIETAYNNDLQLAALFGSYDDAPEKANFLSQYKNLFHHYVHQRAQEEASTFWAGCGAIRRKIFLEVGGFDESYRKPCIEDIELGYRLKKTGHRIRLLKRLQVKHLKRWTFHHLLKSDFFDRALPWTELILRDRNFINDLNLRFSSRLSVIWVYLLLAALIGGWWWSPSFVLAGLFAFSLFIVNSPLYSFFLNQRGFWFMIRTIPWHWFYYFYSGVAFAIGLCKSLRSRSPSPRSSLITLQKEYTGTPPFQERY